MSMKKYSKTVIAAVLLTFLGNINAADWPRYLGPDYNQKSSEKILTRWPADGLKLIWKRPVNTGFSSFSVAKGKAATLEQRELDGKPTEFCLVLDANTGKELWSAPIGPAKYDGGGDTGTRDNRGGDGPRSTPTIDGNKVYVFSAHLGLYCFDLDTGKEIWSHDLIKEYGSKNITWQNAASPVVEGELVIVNGNSPSGTLMAFDKSTGKLAWQVEQEPMTQASPIVAEILGKRQVIFFTQKGLVSVEPATGKVLWRYPFPYNVATGVSPVVAGDMVFCTAGYDVGAGLVKISRDGDNFTAKEVWRKPKQLQDLWSTPVFHEGYLYGMITFKEFGTGPIKCVNLSDGTVVWQKPDYGGGNCIFADGYLIALSDKGELALVKADPKEYIELAKFKAIEGKCWSTPTLANGRLYVRSTKESACYDIKP